MTTATASHTRIAANVSSGWLARRWYYTPKTHRAYSVRQISPGDRRLLAEFALAIDEAAGEREHAAVRDLSDMLFERVLAAGHDMATGFAALESTGGGDRVIGVAAYAPLTAECARFGVAVAVTHRGEQVGRILMSTLVRQAKRVGVRELSAEILWSNRPMQNLAHSLGFTIEAVERDRNLRRLVLALK